MKTSSECGQGKNHKQILLVINGTDYGGTETVLFDMALAPRCVPRDLSLDFVILFPYANCVKMHVHKKGYCLELDFITPLQKKCLSLFIQCINV